MIDHTQPIDDHCPSNEHSTTYVIDRLVVSDQLIELNQDGEHRTASVAILRLEPSESGRYQLVLEVAINHEATNSGHRHQPTTAAASPPSETNLPIYVQPLRPHQASDGRPGPAPTRSTFDGTNTYTTSRPAERRRRLRPGVIAATLTMVALAAFSTMHQSESSTQPPRTSTPAGQPDERASQTSFADEHATDDAALRTGLAGVAAYLPPSQLSVDPRANSLTAPTTTDDPPDHASVDATPDPPPRLRPGRESTMGKQRRLFPPTIAPLALGGSPCRKWRGVVGGIQICHDQFAPRWRGERR
jgi:hypothetical protein